MDILKILCVSSKLTLLYIKSYNLLFPPPLRYKNYSYEIKLIFHNSLLSTSVLYKANLYSKAHFQGWIRVAMTLLGTGISCSQRALPATTLLNNWGGGGRGDDHLYHNTLTTSSTLPEMSGCQQAFSPNSVVFQGQSIDTGMIQFNSEFQRTPCNNY